MSVNEFFFLSEEMRHTASQVVGSVTPACAVEIESNDK